MDQDTKTWAMLLHLSILTNFVIPGAGFIAPIVIWQLKKDQMPEIDAHGKSATNFIISMLIYAAVSVVLMFLFVGFLLVPVLAIIGIVFPIIAGIKANNGELWQYPLTLQLIK